MPPCNQILKHSNVGPLDSSSEFVYFYLLFISLQTSVITLRVCVTCGIDSCVLLLQSGLSEADKEEENKPTSDSEDGYSKDLVTSITTCCNSRF